MLTTMHGVPQELALADLDLEPFAVYMGRINGDRAGSDEILQNRVASAAAHTTRRRG
jgi:hypothetical protein